MKVAAGYYRTVDGRFSLLRDENTGSRAWLLQDRRTGEPVPVGGLRSGARRVAKLLERERSGGPGGC